jgi:hypothetical protein
MMNVFDDMAAILIYGMLDGGAISSKHLPRKNYKHVI